MGADTRDREFVQLLTKLVVCSPLLVLSVSHFMEFFNFWAFVQNNFCGIFLGLHATLFFKKAVLLLSSPLHTREAQNINK
jgi:hypothetical protein